MKRIIKPELLDTLPPADPRAIRSRRDLQRVNAWMRNHAIMAHQLEQHLKGFHPSKLTELGAGDGSFLLRTAKSFSPRWRHTKVRLIDLQANVAPQTLAAFAQIGWKADVVIADVFDHPLEQCDVIVANLFLHHFEASRLRALLRAVSERSGLFIAIEPRRARWPHFCSRLLWAIGCNSVTRHDAVVSVRAGFANVELSSLWPEDDQWKLTERGAGMFSHLFVAHKIR